MRRIPAAAARFRRFRSERFLLCIIALPRRSCGSAKCEPAELSDLTEYVGRQLLIIDASETPAKQTELFLALGRPAEVIGRGADEKKDADPEAGSQARVQPRTTAMRSTPLVPEAHTFVTPLSRLVLLFSPRNA